MESRRSELACRESFTRRFALNSDQHKTEVTAMCERYFASSGKQMNWIQTMFAVLLSWLVTANATHAQELALKRFEFTRIEMGVQFRLAFYASSDDAANKAAEATFSRIKALNAILSDYDSNSELMQLCATSKPGHPVEVSPELWHVLQQSNRISTMSEGAFDVTVGHLTKLWRRSRRQREMPNPDELKQALMLVGHSSVKLEADSGKRFVELNKPGMRLDLGGIAKGYASDEALKTLRELGIARALVAASGDIAVSEPPPGQDAWIINLESPTKSKETIRRLKLVNQAVSTSGDAYQFVEINGQRYSHIVDPKTGLGLTQRGSATVIARRGIDTDAIDTALVILGAKRGLELISALQSQGESIEALILQIDLQEQVQEAVSNGFGKYVANEK